MASTPCSNCQAVMAPGATVCGSCGAARRASSRPQAKFNASALTHTDRVVGIGTVVLFISLFMPWFSVNLGIGTYSADGLSVHGYLYITMFVSLAIIAYFVVTALGVWALPASSPLPRDQLLLVGTAISFVLILLAFLFKPGGSGVGWSYGAFVGLAASVVALVPLARPALQARRNR
jgi:hypothetical protein